MRRGGMQQRQERLARMGTAIEEGYLGIGGTDS